MNECTPAHLAEQDYKSTKFQNLYILHTIIWDSPLQNGVLGMKQGSLQFVSHPNLTNLKKGGKSKFLVGGQTKPAIQLKKVQVDFVKIPTTLGGVWGNLHFGPSPKFPRF